MSDYRRNKTDNRTKRAGANISEIDMTRSKRTRKQEELIEVEERKHREREEKEKKKQRREPTTPSPIAHTQTPEVTAGREMTLTGGTGTGTGDQQVYANATQQQQQQQTQALMDLLRRYPVMWQGHLCLKNDSAAVQMHFLAGTLKLAEYALPQSQMAQPPPSLRISQRMRLDATQLDGVEKRLEKQSDYCLLLALPCGRDPLDVHHQTKTLRECFIKYLNAKDAAGIINVANYVVHIFPPCTFSEKHLKVAAPDLLNSAADSGHLMILIVLGSKP